jgi:cysteine-S-conjugate beta-lyase
MIDDAPETQLIHDGRDCAGHSGIVNIPPYRASTVLFPTVAALEAPDADFTAVRYGRTGTPASQAFESALATLEGGFRAVATGSGLSAVTLALLSVLKAGDHLLMADSVYGPSRAFCTTDLVRFGIETEFYDPLAGDDIARLIRPNTRAVFLESPGSLSFEVQDVPALVAAARRHGLVTLMDNTWSAGLFFQPLRHGVDISIQACTKYVVGHADANLGIVVCNEQHWRTVKETAVRLGLAPGSEDVFLGLRGLRTLSVRLQRHQATGLRLADWLATRPEVSNVLHPARPDCPGHEYWRRDFTGASGLFAVELQPVPRSAVNAMLDGLRLFGMGYSWGGYESLILPVNPARIRTATQWTAAGPLLRIHAGLEDPDDLIRDLSAGFDRLKQGGTA